MFRTVTIICYIFCLLRVSVCASWHGGEIDRSRWQLKNRFKLLEDQRHHNSHRSRLRVEEKYNGEELADEKFECGMNTLEHTLRIFHGRQAKGGEFPWLVHIIHGNLSCGGSIISKEFILTAGHCVSQHGDGSVFAGIHDSPEDMIQSRKVLKTFKHPNLTLILDQDTVARVPDGASDIAIFKLDMPLEWTEYVRPICLPDAHEAELEMGTKLTVAGWGKTEEADDSGHVPKMTTVPVVDFIKCTTESIENNLKFKQLRSQLLCAGENHENILESSICFGDSGGPASIRRTGNKNQWIVIGVNSAVTGNCSVGYNVFTKVTGFLDWIDSVIKNK